MKYVFMNGKLHGFSPKSKKGSPQNNESMPGSLLLGVLFLCRGRAIAYNSPVCLSKMPCLQKLNNVEIIRIFLGSDDNI